MSGRVAIAMAGAAILAGCGSDQGFPPAAEPAVAPEPRTAPAGLVIDLPAGEAEGVVADPESGLAAVATRDPDLLYLVSDPLGDRRLRPIRIPESPRHMQLVAPGGPVLFAAERSDQLVRVGLPDGELRTTLVGDFPHDAAGAGGRVFVADEGGDTISVVAGDAVKVALPAPEQPGGIAASADGDLVAVVAVAERVLATYETGSLKRTGEVDAGVGPTHIVAGDDGRFYVADTEGDAILVFEATPEPRLIDRANLPGAPYGLAIDNEGERLWVTQTERNRVVELELGELAPRRVRSFPTVRQPNTVAVDPRSGYVYVAGRTDGELQVFDPERERRGQG